MGQALCRLSSASALELKVEEILQQLLAFESEDGLGVKLHAVDGEFAMAQAHDFPLGGARGTNSGSVSRFEPKQPRKMPGTVNHIKHAHGIRLDAVEY